MKYLVVIPARGGSKGVLKKNIKKLNGKPLINYTLEAARAVFDDSAICVSTDSIEIKTIVEQTGLKVPFIRPKELATDASSSYDVLLHALDYYNSLGKHPSVIIFLQATSPFRTSEHIKEALKLYHNKLDMVVSVKETQSNPYYVLFEETKEGYLKKSKKENFIRRQDCPKVWEYNGAVYIINTKVLREKPIYLFEKIKKYVMDEKASLDIDTPLDWEVATAIIKKQNL